MENYIMLNGKRIDLTAEQIETLVGKKEKDPFERADLGDVYYWISFDGSVVGETEQEHAPDENAHSVANYCTDKELMEQRALHETLNRLLWRYSMQHGGGKFDWADTDTIKVFIRKNCVGYYLDCLTIEHGIGEVAFVCETVAKAAIEEIVKPFMEQHPEFRW